MRTLQCIAGSQSLFNTGSPELQLAYQFIFCCLKHPCSATTGHKAGISLDVIHQIKHLFSSVIDQSATLYLLHESGSSQVDLVDGAQKNHQQHDRNHRA